MKKFSFQLGTVLDYKQQELDAIKVEHGAILAQVKQQEELISNIELRYAGTNQEFCDKKRTGLTVASAMSYEMGLRCLEDELRKQHVVLQELQKREVAKRNQLVNSKIDTASLEKLREKKLETYQKEVMKQEEQFIEELMTTARVSQSLHQL